ncbi:MAG: Uma2 family endonuclease [Clostridium celatum]|nr:Uma2 family endonuclease [Clostridium celatum]MDU2124095.1 Uma2 family endonuclease [Clostridium celatum]MDU4980382.1 Uma2 family endonuclease [Clostridium celatum]
MPLARDYDYMTYKQFLEYQSLTDQKTEYSNGDIFYMSPTHPNHNKVQNELYFQLRSILNNCNKCDVYTSDVAVKFENEESSYQFEPDIMITCDNKFDGSIYKGIPNLIVEVLSRATKDRDKGLKLDIYEKFGVKQYWLVDINLREVIIYSDNINGKYKTIKTYTEDMIIEWNNSNIQVKDIFKFL